MGMLDKAKWTWDKISVVKKLIEEWKPRACKTEKAYENSLKDFLNDKLGEGHTITAQYGSGRFRADLTIDNTLNIELKYNLESPSEYLRLTGQLMEYKNMEGQIIVLLVGKTDPNLKRKLTSFLEEEGLSAGDSLDPFKLQSTAKVFVVEKKK